jgi:hypothetical protein
LRRASGTMSNPTYRMTDALFGFISKSDRSLHIYKRSSRIP